MGTLCGISYTNISQKEKNWLVVTNGEEVHKTNQKAAEYPEIYTGKPRLVCPEIFCLSLGLVISWQYLLLQIVILQQRGSSQPHARVRLPERKDLTLQSCYWRPSASLILISVIDPQTSPLQGSNINIPNVYSLFSVQVSGLSPSQFDSKVLFQTRTKML